MKYFKLILLFYSLQLIQINGRIDDKKLNELADWFATGMAYYEKAYVPNIAKQTQGPFKYTQSESNLIDLDPYARGPGGVVTKSISTIMEETINEYTEIIYLSKYMPLLEKIISKERDFFSDYVFYHAYKRELGLVFDVYREIDNFLLYASKLYSAEKVKGPLIGTVIRDLEVQEKLFPHKTLNEFIDHWENYFLNHPGAQAQGTAIEGDPEEINSWNDGIKDLRSILLSVNLALFGGVHGEFPSEQSLAYFISSHSEIETANLLTDIFERWGFEKKYRDELEKLYSNFMTSRTGHLLQIFIPANLVDAYVYITLPWGTPYRWKITDTFKEHIIDKNGKKINLSRHMDSKSILDLYRNNRKAFWVEPYYNSTLRSLQGRIILTPSFFDPHNNIKIFRYTNAGLEEEFGADYKRGLRNIVGKMMISYFLDHQEEIAESNNPIMKSTLQSILNLTELEKGRKETEIVDLPEPKKIVSQELTSTIWQSSAKGSALNRYDKVYAFVNDCRRLEKENNKVPPHTPNNKTVRIATYNVHSWTDPFGNSNLEAIMQVIRSINADIIVLEEVLDVTNKLKIFFNDLGYTYQKFCLATHMGYVPFGNMILSKYPSNFSEKIFEIDKKAYGREKRCYIEASIELPNKNIITVYGTHLDVFDATEAVRLAQINEIIPLASSKPNSLITGDFNAVRKKDYLYEINGKTVWDLLDKDNKERNQPKTVFTTPTAVFDALEQAGFVDSFAQASLKAPKFTVWSGTMVDFILLKNWNLPVKGSYVYYNAASDHIPVIMDIQLG